MAEDRVRSPSLIDVLDAAIAAGAASHHTALTARVEEYDRARQVVRVQPMVGSIRTDSDGVEHEELYPAIVEVPVAWPGAGGARLTFPLQRGDHGLLLFCDRSLDEWKVNRGTQPVIPKDPRMHSLQDAVFLPGLRSPSAPWGGARTDALTLGYADEGGQGMQIHLTSNGIALGEPMPQYAVALAELVLQALQDIANKFNTHTHGGVTSGPGFTGTPTASTPPTTIIPPSSVGSTTVKTKG